LRRVGAATLRCHPTWGDRGPVNARHLEHRQRMLRNGLTGRPSKASRHTLPTTRWKVGRRRLARGRTAGALHGCCGQRQSIDPPWILLRCPLQISVSGNQEVRAKSRRRKRPNPTGYTVMGVVWYRETDWPRIEAMFSDADELHDSYAGSLKSAKGSVKRLTRPGATVEPFVINIDDFVGWCSVVGCPRRERSL
jgi:hypothetical protein